ncbi:MAG: hypothetical protein ACKVH0_19940, partial [Alphaproteobacteria bacterium]
RILLLNSMGGSMGRLAKELQVSHGMDVDCFVAAYPPRRNLTFAGEVNVNGVYTHDEWREFMRWAVGHYDIIQSSTLPLSAPVAELYDWLTQVMGERHIWRSTGFVHHYIHREDVVPLDVYKADLNVTKSPGPDQYLIKSMPIVDGRIQIGDN